VAWPCSWSAAHCKYLAQRQEIDNRPIGLLSTLNRPVNIRPVFDIQNINKRKKALTICWYRRIKAGGMHFRERPFLIPLSMTLSRILLAPIVVFFAVRKSLPFGYSLKLIIAFILVLFDAITAAAQSGFRFNCIT